MGTERRDLFGAVVSDVPLTDMLRFPKMGMGAAWMDEYGNPDNPADAKVLSAYSPLQNVREGGALSAFPHYDLNRGQPCRTGARAQTRSSPAPGGKYALIPGGR